MSKQPASAPIKPRLLLVLASWVASSSANIELLEQAASDQDFDAAERLEAEGSTLKNIKLMARLKKLQLSDTVVTRLEAAGLRASAAAWLRVELRDSRLTGADLGTSSFGDCLFRGVKLDEIGFRFARFKRVVFEDCVLRQADFSGARLAHVAFIDCDFQEINFDGAVCQSVDLRGQNLSNIKGVLGLKGAVISSEQLIQLAPLLAAELNLTIDDGI